MYIYIYIYYICLYVFFFREHLETHLTKNCNQGWLKLVLAIAQTLRFSYSSNRHISCKCGDLHAGFIKHSTYVYIYIYVHIKLNT